MTLGNIREQAGEYWRQDPSQHIDQSAFLSNLHDTQPQGEDTRQPREISNAVFDEENVESIMAGNTSKSPKNISFTSAITKAMMKNAIQI